MENNKELEFNDKEYMKRVYNSLAVVVITETLILFTLYIFIDNTYIYWLSILLFIITLIPLSGGINLIYNYRKDNKQ